MLSAVTEGSVATGRLLRIGVTGHRDLGDPVTVARAVDGVLDDLLAGHGDEVTLLVVSSLADGADRLVVERVLARPDSSLVAILPLATDDYVADFAAGSSADFLSWLEWADRIDVTGPDGTGSRESAYEAAGRAVVDACDVLLALWDGEGSRGQGGTAEIVDYARRSGKHVVVVPVTRAVPTDPDPEESSR
jgi:hypothetical protein